MTREELVELVYGLNKMILNCRLSKRAISDEVQEACEIVKAEAEEIIRGKEGAGC